MPSTIAGVLGVREEGGGLEDRLAHALRGKRVLLIPDNFERVVAAAPVVADLLAKTSGLKIQATSLTPLHVYGEREYPLAPLSLPDPTHLRAIERLSQYESVRLFIDRAQAVKPDFAVTNANAAAVTELCHRLDGLPLAIEQAAARVKVLPPQTMLQRMEKRLPLLTGGARTLPARQQTMRDAIACSYDLLSSEEQTLFRRLAVFPGGCTLEAAEAVTAPDDGAVAAFDGVASLVDYSLLRQDEDPGGAPRFRMLETVREYGLERLHASGEEDELRRRQATWCLALAETAEPALDPGPHQARWIDRLDDELPNLREAIAWLLESGDAARVLRLFAATQEDWTERSYYAEVRRWLSAALAAAPDAPVVDRTPCTTS